MKEESRVNYETYYAHNEKTPDSYHPLVQYLEKTAIAVVIPVVTPVANAAPIIEKWIKKQQKKKQTTNQ